MESKLSVIHIICIEGGDCATESNFFEIITNLVQNTNVRIFFTPVQHANKKEINFGALKKAIQSIKQETERENLDLSIYFIHDNDQPQDQNSIDNTFEKTKKLIYNEFQEVRDEDITRIYDKELCFDHFLFNFFKSLSKEFLHKNVEDFIEEKKKYKTKKAKLMSDDFWELFPGEYTGPEIIFKEILSKSNEINSNFLSIIEKIFKTINGKS